MNKKINAEKSLTIVGIVFAIIIVIVFYYANQEMSVISETNNNVQEQQLELSRDYVNTMIDMMD